jgi:hypothetical protein
VRYHSPGYNDLTMKLKYAYILPGAYFLCFLINSFIGKMILSIVPIRDLGLLGLLLQVWLIIYVIIDAPTGVILQVFDIEPGTISIIVISLAWYFIFGVLLDFYDALPWRRKA